MLPSFVNFSSFVHQRKYVIKPVLKECNMIQGFSFRAHFTATETQQRRKKERFHKVKR
jgi:hypothetical protein